MPSAPSTPPAPADWFIYTVIFVVLIGLLFTLISLAQRLASAKWSLGDALSEEADLTATDDKGALVYVNNVPFKKTQLVASSSRLMAFIGTLAVFFLFIGFGAFVLWDFAKSGAVPSSTAEITKYLAGGLTLFAPYAVNKLSSIGSTT